MIVVFGRDRDPPSPRRLREVWAIINLEREDEGAFGHRR
jgi:hypothetical protein